MNYKSHKKNPKEIRATPKLVELCSKFEHSVIERSKRSREKSNIPAELTQIPDYRQLLLTNKFDKFTRCKCDHTNGEHKTDDLTGSKCSQHQRKTARSAKRKSNSSSHSSSKSSSNERDSSSSSCSSDTSSSSFSSSGSSASENENKKSEKKEDEHEFEDIRSMEIDRKLKHPERLHPDLSFNEPDQVNYFQLNFGMNFLFFIFQLFYFESRPTKGHSVNASLRIRISERGIKFITAKRYIDDHLVNCLFETIINYFLCLSPLNHAMQIWIIQTNFFIIEWQLIRLEILL